MVFGLPIWLVVSLVVLVVLVVLLKTTNQVYLLSLFKDNFFYIVFIAFFIFVAISFTVINTKNNIDYTSLEGLKEGAGIYVLWAKGIFGNVVDITGYAIGLDWVPDDQNSTIKK